jgi:hypothetical protein
MSRVIPKSTTEERVPGRGLKFVLGLALVAACTVLWTGCNTMTASPAQTSHPAAQSGRRISIQTALPNATVGTSFHEVLSISGGGAPYLFAVIEGTLPAGLVLNPFTGSISGTPTQAGNFAFTIQVIGEPTGTSGLRAYTVTVAPCLQCVTVQISPADPSVAPGGKLQFTATVSNTSNTAVTWSASAGSISSNGLFTAPASTSTKSITVTATSKAQTSAQATSAIALTSTVFTIATLSVPPAVKATPYLEPLTASGGQTPYQWSIASGSLPAGLQLDASTGTLSGSASQTGTFTFSVRGTDAASHTAQESYSLFVSSSQTCGPPAYNCSRSDTQLLVPTAPPHLGSNPLYYGGHLGAGIVAADPVYNNNRILRVTDGNTDSAHPGESFATDSSAEKSVTSYDESLFLVHSATGICLFQYDAASFSAAFHGCFNNVGIEFDFGYTEADQRAFYSFYKKKLYRFVVNTSTWTIAADPAFNGGLGYFDPDNASCLNGQIAANGWYIDGTAMSSDDNTVIAAVGPEQDKNPYYVVWNATKGCQWMNVQTWQVSQGWNTGLSNPVNIAWASGNPPAQAGGIHNAQIDRSGSFGVLAVHGVPTLKQKFFWTIGTNKVDDTCVNCMSHWACDFGVCFWSADKSLSELTVGGSTFTPNMDTSVSQPPEDEHMSHANAEPGEHRVYLAAYQPGQGGSTVSQIWDDEIIGVNWDGTLRTIRFNKHWDSGYGGFNGATRCSISRQGNYAICGSDFQMYNLDKGFGNGLNQDTCDHNLNAGITGTNGCRTDILLFELR